MHFFHIKYLNYASVQNQSFFLLGHLYIFKKIELVSWKILRALSWLCAEEGGCSISTSLNLEIPGFFPSFLKLIRRLYNNKMNIFQELFIFTQLCLLCYGFDLTLLHVNDIHSRFEETDKYSGVCEGMYYNRCSKKFIYTH